MARFFYLLPVVWLFNATYGISSEHTQVFRSETAPFSCPAPNILAHDGPGAVTQRGRQSLEKSDLKPAGKEALKALVKSLKIMERGNVTVEGHTDDVGSAASNKQLSLARAKSVSAELNKLLPSQKFRWKEHGHGEEKPLVDNDSDTNRAKNRRVEVLVLPNQKPTLLLGFFLGDLSSEQFPKMFE
jgi:hypothetical protein